VLKQIAAVSGIDGQVARERSTQGLVGGDEGAQPLVDLAIHALPALLNRDHREQADTDADQGNDRQAQQGGDERMQGAEIEIAQPDFRKAIRPDESSCLSNAARICFCNKAVAVNLCSDATEGGIRMRIKVFRFV
jgi:hypothetical protein